MSDKPFVYRDQDYDGLWYYYHPNAVGSPDPDFGPFLSESMAIKAMNKQVDQYGHPIRMKEETV